MRLMPAIDVLNGRIVRLRRGDYDAVTHYDIDPLDQMKRHADEGATWMHLVDLDAARSAPTAATSRLIESIASHVGMSVQLGGGIRSDADVVRVTNLGVARMVMGTVAVRKPEFVQRHAAAAPGKIVVAVDALDGVVRIDGWRSESQLRAVDLAASAETWGAAAVLFTDIDRDGAGAGANITATSELQAGLQINVIASGGIHAISDIHDLTAVGVREAVCGRALLDGVFTYAEAAACITDVQASRS